MVASLEVAIGLVFIYLLLSLFCSAFNEMVAWMLDSRARNLERGLKSMILRRPRDFSLFKTHPMMKPSYESGTFWQRISEMRGKLKYPTYIEPHVFASVVLDVLDIDKVNKQDFLKELQEAAKKSTVLQGALAEVLSLVNKVEILIDEGKVAARLSVFEEEVKALLEKEEGTSKQGEAAREFHQALEALRVDWRLSLSQRLARFRKNASGILDKIKEPFDKLNQDFLKEEFQQIQRDALQREIDKSAAYHPEVAAAKEQLSTLIELHGTLADSIRRSVFDEELQSSLLMLCQDVRNDAKEFKKSVERWFHRTLATISGCYKRRTTLALLLYASVITVISNADTIEITSRLMRDSVYRSMVVDAASSFVEEQDQADQAASAPSDEEQTPLDVIRDLQAKGARIGSPLGWCPDEIPQTEAGASSQESAPATEPECSPWDRVKHYSQNGWGLFAKVFGFLLTIIAISLGAPFWFDLLSRFISLRHDGREESKEKASPAEV